MVTMATTKMIMMIMMMIEMMVMIMTVTIMISKRSFPLFPRFSLVFFCFKQAL